MRTSKKTLIIIALVTLISCNDNVRKKVKDLNIIEIGSYQFDFPNDFKLVKGNGIDSYVGEVIGDSLTIEFDYGYYSNSFTETPDEYLKSFAIGKS